MAHWTTPWLARRWVEGEYECVHFCADILRTEFGVRPAVPAVPAGLRARDATLPGALAAVSMRTHAPIDGDLVLMMHAGGVRIRGYHLGVYVAGAGAPCVLHLSRDDGAQVHRLDELDGVGLVLEGVYRCRS